MYPGLFMYACYQKVSAKSYRICYQSIHHQNICYLEGCFCFLPQPSPDFVVDDPRQDRYEVCALTGFVFGLFLSVIYFKMEASIYGITIDQFLGITPEESQMINSMLLKQFGDKLPAEEKEKIQAAIDAARESRH